MSGKRGVFGLWQGGGVIKRQHTNIHDWAVGSPDCYSPVLLCMANMSAFLCVCVCVGAYTSADAIHFDESFLYIVVASRIIIFAKNVI